MNAKIFLQQIKKLDRMIENKQIEKAQWKELATSTTTQLNGEKVQSSHNPHKMANAIVKYIDLEREIDSCIDRLIDTKRDVISVIEQLNPDEYDVLHKFYIQGLSFKEIAFADKKKRSESWATTIHGRALKNVQRILDERGNEE